MTSARERRLHAILGVAGAALVALGFYTAGRPSIYASVVVLDQLADVVRDPPRDPDDRADGDLRAARPRFAALRTRGAHRRGWRSIRSAGWAAARCSSTGSTSSWCTATRAGSGATGCRSGAPRSPACSSASLMYRAIGWRDRRSTVAEPAAPTRHARAARHRLIGRRISGWRGYESSRLRPASGHRRRRAVLSRRNVAWAARPSKLPPTPASPDEKFWMSVRDQFVMPKELTMLNAANLCPVVRPGARDDVPADEGHGSGSVAGQPREARRRPREHAQAAGGVPARHAGRDRHHAQHERVEQPRVDRHRSEGRRRGAAHRRQPSEQPHRVAGEGEALRLHREGRADAEPASRDRSTTSTRSRRRSRRGRRSSAFTHQTSTVGDLFPAKEICRARARARHPDAWWTARSRSA